MAEVNQNQLAYVRYIMAAKKLSPSGLAELAGLSSTTLTRPLNDPDYKFAISSRTIQSIEAVAEITYAEFLAGIRLQNSDANNGGEELQAGAPARIIPGRELVSQSGEMLPVYAAARGGDGHIIVTFDEIERVKMPTVLQGVRGGYGLLIEGTSMIPAYHPGDTALVHPHLKPARGHNHVFYHRPPHGGEEEAIVKELLAFNDRDWTLKQWNPVKEWKESRQVWQTCHRIVGKYDRR
jgi:Predicted transcriptional regulator